MEISESNMRTFDPRYQGSNKAVVLIPDKFPGMVVQKGGNEQSLRARFSAWGTCAFILILAFLQRNVMNAYAGERITPNVSEPFHLSSEWLEVDMMAMVRTPDVDNPSITPGTPANVKAMASMTGKQRRFEFQCKLQLKKVPTGKQVYFA
jgi:hypothetical protein